MTAFSGWRGRCGTEEERLAVWAGNDDRKYQCALGTLRGTREERVPAGMSFTQVWQVCQLPTWDLLQGGQTPVLRVHPRSVAAGGPRTFTDAA